jgi:hypothetical protein
LPFFCAQRGALGHFAFCGVARADFNQLNHNKNPTFLYARPREEIMKKRILSAVMSLALIFGLMPTAFAAGATDGKGGEGGGDESDSSGSPEITYDVETSIDENWHVTQNITITIPEGMNADEIHISPFVEEVNADLSLVSKLGYWQPQDTATINIKVVDNSGNGYTYKDSSVQLGAAGFDFNNKSQVVYRTYNPALYELIGIENSWNCYASEVNKLSAAINDNSLAESLKNLDSEKFANGIDDLYKYYMDYFEASSIEDIPDSKLNLLFSGSCYSDFIGKRDTFLTVKESCEEVAWLA